MQGIWWSENPIYWPERFVKNLIQLCRNIGYAWQRCIKGYSTYDTWCLDEYLAAIIYQVAENDVKNFHGYPAEYEDFDAFRLDYEHLGYLMKWYLSYMHMWTSDFDEELNKLFKERSKYCHYNFKNNPDDKSISSIIIIDNQEKYDEVSAKIKALMEKERIIYDENYKSMFVYLEKLWEHLGD